MGLEGLVLGHLGSSAIRLSTTQCRCRSRALASLRNRRRALPKVSGREHANQTLETSRPVGVSDLGDRERFARVPERNLDRSLEALLLFHD